MKRINNDVNGNPRYVVHFYDLLTDLEGLNLNILERYELALKKARKVGGKMYRGKDFGGGIVFQSYNIIETINKAKGAI
jgi:hypothetical protein